MAKKYTLDGDNRLQRLSEIEALNILTADDFDILSGRSGKLPFDALSGAFTVGQVVTGAGSDNTAKIYAIELDEDDPTTGYLLVNDADGLFQNNDNLTDPITGVAVSTDALGPHTGLFVGFDVLSAAVFAVLVTGKESKSNLAQTFPVNFSITADLRSIQLTSGVVLVRKINKT
jgi:hypothetical protein